MPVTPTTGNWIDGIDEETPGAPPVFVQNLGFDRGYTNNPSIYLGKFYDVNRHQAADDTLRIDRYNGDGSFDQIMCLFLGTGVSWSQFHGLMALDDSGRMFAIGGNPPAPYHIYRVNQNGTLSAHIVFSPPNTIHEQSNLYFGSSTGLQKCFDVSGDGTKMYYASGGAPLIIDEGGGCVSFGPLGSVDSPKPGFSHDFYNVQAVAVERTSGNLYLAYERNVAWPTWSAGDPFPPTGAGNPSTENFNGAYICDANGGIISGSTSRWQYIYTDTVTHIPVTVNIAGVISYQFWTRSMIIPDGMWSGALITGSPLFSSGVHRYDGDSTYSGFVSTAFPPSFFFVYTPGSIPLPGVAGFDINGLQEFFVTTVP